MPKSFKEVLLEASEFVQADLLDRLSSSHSQELTEAMRYAVAGGKGLRGFLVLA